VEDIRKRNKAVIFLGGTAFYLNCLINGLIKGVDHYPELRLELLHRAEIEGPQALHAELAKRDQESAIKIHPNDTKRIVRALEVIHITGQPLSKLKEERTEKFINGPFKIAGLLRNKEELTDRIKLRTKKMFEMGFVEEVKEIANRIGFGLESGKAIGYREVLAHIRGEKTLDETIERINITTRRYSKKQMTWYKRFDQIKWFEVNSLTSEERLSESVASYFMDC